MQLDKLPAILGGEPISSTPLHIVRPRFPDLSGLYNAFSESLASGMVTNHGRYVRKFEKELSTYLKVPTITANNGQSALMMMLKAAGIDGGEVIVPSYTFCATPHAVRWCGAEPVFADIDPAGTLCLDTEDVERRITNRTLAILGVDVYGILADSNALEALGDKYGIKVLFDSAPAFGSRLNEQVTGSRGDAQSFSFHATKAFTTMEGGCVSSADSAIIAAAIALRNFGQLEDGNSEIAGINGKMQEICALIGIAQLEHFDEVIEHRGHMAAYYKNGFSNIEGISFAHVTQDQKPAWLYFPVILNTEILGIKRNLIAKALAAENLHVRKYFDIPCHKMGAYRDANSELTLKITEKVAANVLAFPIYNDMKEEECQMFIDAFANIIKYAKKINQKIN